MKQVYGGVSATTAHVLKDLLAAEGVAVTLGGELTNLSEAGWGVDLYLVDDADFDRARAIIVDFEGRMAEDPDGDGDGAAPATWRCPGCGEMHAAVFQSCWHCGRDRD